MSAEPRDTLPELIDDSDDAVPIWLVAERDFERWSAQADPRTQRWLRANAFKGQDARNIVVPDGDGGIAGVAVGLGADKGAPLFPIGALPQLLPPGDYYVAEMADTPPELLALGWALGLYRFDAYKSTKPEGGLRRLVVDRSVDRRDVSRLAEATYFVRTLINTPAADMGPAALEAAARVVADRYGADINVVTGDTLERDFPMVHAVGRAAAEAPRLIDIAWGDPAAPKVTLVGKGVCFDTGGLNLKTGSSMTLMKKDMGGAANVLGLARAVMDAGIKVRLRVLVPAVENAIGGNAFRPGDVLRSRKGLSVEIGNTDAEGRLILADALALAAEDKPDLLIDMATLTGAARTALGPDLPPFYTDDDALAGDIAAAAKAVKDPLWRMPLWPGYDPWLQSKVADTQHIGDSPMAGSIIAALFLKRFVEGAKCWVHFDIYGWTPRALPGQPLGGEAQGMRALYRVIARRFAAPRRAGD